MTPSRILILLGLIGLGSSQIFPAPCEKLQPSANGGLLLSVDGLMECFNLIPFNTTTRADFVSQLKTSLQFHASLPYLKQRNPDVDPLRDMSAIINDASLTTRWAVSSKLRDWVYYNYEKAMIGFGDNCFAYVTLYQPFAIALPAGSSSGLPVILDAVNSGNPDFPTDDALLNDFWKAKANNLDPFKYKGYEVKSINGKDPYELAKSLNDAHVEDLSGAFTSYYINNGSWVPAYGSFSFANAYVSNSFFSKPVTYELKSSSGETVTLSDIPWAALPTHMSYSTDSPLSDKDFGSFSNFLMEGCFNIDGLPSFGGFGLQAAGTSRHPARLTARDVALPIPIAQGTRPRVFKVDDSTLAFAMSDFSISLGSAPLLSGSEIEPETLNAFKEVDSSFAETKKSAPSATRLIIDVSSAAYTCEAKVILQYLFGETKSLEYTLPLTPEVRAVSKSSDSIVSTFYKTTFLNPVSGSSIYENTQTPNLPGSPTFSSRFTRSNCDEYIKKILPTMDKAKGGWNPSNVAIVGDGYCTSGCHDFVRTLKQQFGIKSYVYGFNTKNFPSTSQSFYGTSPAYFFWSLPLKVDPLFSQFRQADRNVRFGIQVYNVFDGGAPSDASPIIERKVSDGLLNAHSGDYPMGVWKAAAAVMAGGQVKDTEPNPTLPNPFPPSPTTSNKSGAIKTFGASLAAIAISGLLWLL
ncbi:hypothetical protein HDU97_001701 [Phlyctochytrium planicorne]|nr:hypothetical protein HDU97_001701 [Phlyctochytrium planicorne]